MFITSPYYPRNYANDRDCLFFVHTANYTVDVTFVVQIIQQMLDPGLDFLMLGIGSDPANQDSVVLTLTSDEFPNNTVMFPGPTMWLRFTSDFYYVMQGFILSIYASPDEGKAYEVHCLIYSSTTLLHLSTQLVEGLSPRALKRHRHCADDILPKRAVVAADTKSTRIKCSFQIPEKVTVANFNNAPSIWKLQWWR